MVILNSKKPSDSSSTEGSDSASDDDKKRFYKQPSGQRQSSSSSSSPESNTDQSSGDGDPPASSVPQPKRAPPAKVRDPSPSAKAKRDSKRNREEVGGQEQAPAKRKNAPKKTDAGKKPSPPRQRETLPRGAGEKTPAKSVKEKKSSASKDEKNPRRQIVQEAAATTPGKKIQHLWSDKDEMVFANALLASSKRGIDISKNLAQIHQDVKDSMEYEYTKAQLYEKLRRLKNKYQTILDKLKEGNMKEDSFPFKAPHERTMFKICKQLWYEDPAADEDEGMEEAPPKDAGRLVIPEVPAEEGDANDNAGGDSGDSQEQDEEEDQEDADPTVSAQQNDKILPVNGNGNGSTVQQDDKLTLINGLKELRTDCMKMIEAAEARTSAFVEKQFKSARESLQRGDGGIRPSLAFSVINRELMDGIHSAWEFPLLDAAKAERLEQKWRELRIVEMEVFSRRLDLLQEECKMCLEGLKSPTGSGRS